MKEKLLYLCHRIPFPPNKGDKIAAYNILKFLSRHYDVYLGCFIDDPNDFQYQSHVSALCKDTIFVPLNPLMAKVKGFSAFLSGKPITLPYYSSGTMQTWVDKIIKQESINKALIFSGSMAQYVSHERYQDLHVVMDFVDIDSDKWRQYAEKKQGLMRWIYRREHKTLSQYERVLASQFAVSCFVSDAETHMFRSMLPSTFSRRIKTLSNGIDSHFFSPSAQFTLAESYPVDQQNYIVFTGAMDYWANIDAVTWFIERVWPVIRNSNENCYFYIVGSGATKKVHELQKVPGVVVTGRVEDVRPYLHYAKAAVAPMQIARGIQNKILEAMSMACPVAASSLGMEGIVGADTQDQSHVIVTDSATRMAEWIDDKLSKEKSLAEESRQWLKIHYSWEAQLSPLLHYLERE